MLLIRHGRRTCMARAPRCDECPLRRMCPRAGGGWPAHERAGAPLQRGARAGGHRGRLGRDLRDGPGRDRAAAHDGLPRLPLPPGGAAGGADLPPAAAPAVARRLAGGPADGGLPDLAATSSRPSGWRRRRPPTRASSPACSWSSRRCSGALVLRDRITPLAWAAALVVGAGPVPALGRRAASSNLRGDGLVLLARSRSPRTSWPPRGECAEHDVGALLAVQLGVCGLVCLVIAAAAGSLEAPEGWTVWSALMVTSLVASALGYFVQTLRPAARAARAHRADPGLRARVRRPVRLAAGRRPPVGRRLAGRRADHGRRSWRWRRVPRFRPPRPLPEG